MKTLENRLRKYGAVKTCKIVNNDTFVLVITEGFESKGSTVFKFLGEVTGSLPDFKKIESCITENDLAVLVLSK